VTKVALFVAGLAGAFLVALLLGRALDVEARTVAEPSHGGDTGGHEAAAPAGLAVEEDGYRLVAERDALVAGRAEPYAFRILGPGGEIVRDFDVEHERRLHLIVAGRAPNTHFLHVHPEQREDGSWTVPVELPANGSYRVFADFTTAGERRTLGIDLAGYGGPGEGPAQLTRYDVELHGHGDRLEFAVRDGASPVQVEPYLGALGHLVVLREGDLAYIHAHADADELAFDVPFPGGGRYRAYLQFQVAGRVETAFFELQR
jgi:hypothetical protein